MRITLDGLHFSYDLTSRMVQLLSEELHSLTVSIQALQGVVSGLTSQRAATDSTLHAIHSMIAKAQEPLDLPICSLIIC